MASLVKGPDDFTASEAKKIRDELASITTGAERDAVYAKHKTSRQRFIKIASAYNLEKLPPTKKKSAPSNKGLAGFNSGNKKTKPSIAKTSASAPKTSASAPKTAAKQPPQPRRVAKPSAITAHSRISPETKELIARALLKLLED